MGYTNEEASNALRQVQGRLAGAITLLRSSDRTNGHQRNQSRGASQNNRAAAVHVHVPNQFQLRNRIYYDSEAEELKVEGQDYRQPERRPEQRP